MSTVIPFFGANHETPVTIRDEFAEALESADRLQGQIIRDLLTLHERRARINDEIEAAETRLKNLRLLMRSLVI